ncbi:DUF2630 family protein [Streptomyces griseoviridis]|uniref:DUF2630 domain-containing protein n=2 Tax=Streptomyces TaxID=1883 RepID=A0A3Q9L178_STRGD|nr:MULTISPECIES: DUF2630 family protein [Streptomyces]AZS88947.1 DUF2630 family protein [Streptomyces griseoviridis]MDT0473117.1 DUF2630 family protein [Streptomyces sp. DSM 41014]QCN84209.1 DUF2630 domain-containing protein [Streptomyces griseoviridis]
MEQDQRILARITEMVADEHRLRQALAAGEIDDVSEQRQLGQLERELDQCWDLLRRRRAKSEFGENPDEAQVRPSSQVEGYRG